MHFIPVQYYSLVFYYMTFLICLVYSMKYINSNSCDLLLKQNSLVTPTIFAIIVTLFVGLRPISWWFQDMLNYSYVYNRFSGNLADIDWSGEWGLPVIAYVCKAFHWPATIYFLLIGVGYTMCQAQSVKKLLPENALMAFLFILSSFSFWGFASNGIRNGLGCAVAMLAITYMSQKEYLPAIIWALFAVAVHRSTMLPIMMLLVSFYIIKSSKHAIYFWLFSIIISLLSGNVITSFFAQLGFDERMTMYMSNTSLQFSHSGFRWDFLIYSSVPVYLTWYITQNRGIHDEVFNLLANTYILSNAFWIMVIRASFSNRFAYLSWFLYPVIIAYAMIRLPIWNDQDKKAGWALLAHASFTIFMYMIGKLY